MHHLNPANLLSLSRILLTPPILLLLLTPWREGYFVAGWLFVVAAMTDILDGYLARRWRSTSSFGVFLDLVADKVLVLAVLGLLVGLALIPAWMAILIVTREAVVMGLRCGSAARGRVIPAAAWGKGKTVITSGGIAAVILGESLGRGAWAEAMNVWGWLDAVAAISSPIMAAATLLTLVSGVLYARVAVPVLLGAPHLQTAVRHGEHPRTPAA